MSVAEILTEEQVEKVAKRVAGNEPLRLYLAEFGIDVDALCATVRALRSELRKANDAGGELLDANTALREQLAETQQQLTETQKAVDHWVTMYNKVSGDNTRLIDQQEEPDVKHAAKIVSDAMRNSGFTDNKPSARSWAEGGESVVIAQLQSQLAQVTQERDDWKNRVVVSRDGRCPYHPWMFVEKEQP